MARLMRHCDFTQDDLRGPDTSCHDMGSSAGSRFFFFFARASTGRMICCAEKAIDPPSVSSGSSCYLRTQFFASKPAPNDVKLRTFQQEKD